VIRRRLVLSRGKRIDQRVKSKHSFAWDRLVHGNGR
jgi:hypothetical protein